MKDRQHLLWIYNRMIEVHKENPNYDYMIKFRDILKTLHKADVVGRSEQLICTECENPYPHSCTDGSYICEDCGHKWVN